MRRAAEACRNCGSLDSDWLDERGRVLSPPRLVADVRECVGCEQKAGRMQQEGKLDPVTAAGRYVFLRPATDDDYRARR